MLNQSLDPDQVVAMGAAIQSALITGDTAVEDIVLTDVCSHTLGVETAHEIGSGRFEEGYFRPIIDRNTTVLASRSDIFSTLHPSQPEMRLQVYQGEGRMVSQTDDRLSKGGTREKQSYIVELWHSRSSHLADCYGNFLYL